MPQEETRTDLSTELALGGQALIEGVLMRSPTRVAMAARTPSGTIAVKTYPYTPITRRIKWLGLPILRGAVGLVESMKIGMDALNWSAEQAMPEEADAKPRSRMKERFAMGLSVLVGVAFAIGLFMFLPLWLGRLAAGSDGDSMALRQVIVNSVAGGVRIAILLAYLWLISRWKDIHRVFQYHGSEHKTIFAFESGANLTVDRVLNQIRFHPRCGTSFLLIVALSAILFFVVVDSIIVAIFGEYPNTLVRLCVHLPLIPLVAGISYEILKYSAKNTENRLVKLLIQPGLWLQRITTQEPDETMCEVAIVSLKTALTGEAPAATPVDQAAPQIAAQA